MARQPVTPPGDRRPSVRNILASLAFMVERVTRIELALSAWEADVLPLNYTRAAGLADAGRGLVPKRQG
jgi:hypothetical protein